MYFNGPSEKEKQLQKHRQDSIALAEKQKAQAKPAENKTTTSSTPTTASNIPLTDSAKRADSAAALNKKLSQYGIFYPAITGTPASTDVENDLVKVTISNRGGKISSVELKDFKTSIGAPLRLFYPDSTTFGLILNAYSNSMSTDTMYFSENGVSNTADSTTITMRLKTSDPAKYIDYIYKLKKGSYMVGCDIKVVGLQNVLPSNSPYINLLWAMNTPSQEANIQNQQRTSTVYYKFYNDEVDYINAGKDDKKTLPNDITWVSFKQQFFSSVLIADSKFSSPEVSVHKDNAPNRVKSFSAVMTIPYGHQADETFGMHFYFGPNNYNLLRDCSKEADLQLDKEINLGWGIFGWVNRFIVIPIFDFLNRFNLNYGLAILILTIVIKALLFPIAFRSYVSSAKMRLLKPEVDAINKKFPDTADAMKKQQTMMALYKKAGVSPMAGCVPLLLQLPILYALFSFFPASIELRQKGFLWAHDLSTYDNAISFHNFSLPVLGDHLSLFAVLFTISQYLTLSINQQVMGAAPGNDQMGGKTMKWMMYIMPLIFFGVLNNYSAGLSYYYFLANLITFGQTYFAKLFIDEDALHRKMQENKAKVLKPSKFQQRLEQMMKEQQTRAKKR
jgi:YidC/Oxa1 family membrane protein insertase